MAVTIVGELVLHGYLEMSSLVLKLLSKSAPSATETLVEFRKAKEAFESLVSAGYVHRLPQLDENDDALFQSNGNGSSEADGKTVRIKPKVPKFVHHQTEMQKQLVPDIKMNGKATANWVRFLFLEIELMHNPCDAFSRNSHFESSQRRYKYRYLQNEAR